MFPIEIAPVTLAEEEAGYAIECVMLGVFGWTSWVREYRGHCRAVLDGNSPGNSGYIVKEKEGCDGGNDECQELRCYEEKMKRISSMDSLSLRSWDDLQMNWK